MVDRVPRCGPAGGSPVRDALDMFAVHVRLGQSLSRAASTCNEDPRVRTRAQSPRAAQPRPPRSYRVRLRSGVVDLVAIVCQLHVIEKQGAVITVITAVVVTVITAI